MLFSWLLILIFSVVLANRLAGKSVSDMMTYLVSSGTLNLKSISLMVRTHRQ